MALSRRTYWRIGLFVTCAALAVFLYVTRHLDLTVYRMPLAQALSLTLGRTVEIQGDIRLALSTSPKLTVHHVRVENAAWSQEKDLLTADTLEIRLGLRELWNKHLDIRKIRATGIRIWLEKDEHGNGNWALTKSGGGDTSVSTHISNILIQDAIIHWQTPREKTKKFVLGEVSLNLEYPGRYRVKTQATLDAWKVSAEADLHQLSDNHWRVEPRIKVNDAVVYATIDWQREDNKQFIASRVSIPLLTLPTAAQSTPSPGPSLTFQDAPLPGTDFLPRDIHIDAELDIGEIRWGQRGLQQMKIHAKYDYPTLVVSPMSLRWNEGEITARANLTAENNEWRLRVAADAERLDFGALTQGALQARAKKISLEYSTHGATLAHLIRRTHFASHAEIEYAQLGGPRHTLYNARWDARYRPLKGAVATLHGTLQSKSFTVQWFSDSFLRAWINREDARLKLAARHGGTYLTVESTLRELSHDVKPLRVELHGSRLKELDELLGTRLPLLSRYDISGVLHVARDYVTGAQILIETPASYVSGAFFYQWGNDEPPVLRVLLSQSTLDMNEMRHAFKPPNAVESRPIGRTHLISDESLKPVLDIPLVLEVNTDKLDIVDSGYTAHDIKLHLRAMPGAIESNIRIEDLVHGKVQGTLLMYRTGPDIALRFDIDIKGFDYGLAMKQTGVNDQVQGAADASITFTGHGATIKSLLHNAFARIDFNGGKGVIANRYLRLWGDDVVRQLLPGNWLQEERSQLNCAYMRLHLADGALRTDALVVDTEHITIAGSGGIVIDTEQLEFILSPRPKNPSLLSLATPLRIRGTLAKPEAGVHNMATLWTLATLAAGAVNPVVLLARFASLGDLGNDACRNTAGDAPPPARNLPAKVVSQLNSLVDTLQHPFDQLPDVDLTAAAKLLTAPIPLLMTPFNNLSKKAPDSPPK